MIAKLSSRPGLAVGMVLLGGFALGYALRSLKCQCGIGET